jgi:hypothetical protein
MPRDVEFIGWVEPPRESAYVPEAKDFIYLHIKSAVCFDRPEGAALCIEPVFDFYERYLSCRKQWSSELESAMSMYQGG